MTLPKKAKEEGVAFPWSDTRKLTESLKNGELCLGTALSQFGAVMRETLKVIEEFASDQMKSNLDRKLKVEKMEKLINDLGEKCQAMQQALLYKEEKYDEKCREVERYKVICELSAKAAVSDDLYYTPQTRNDNNNDDIMGDDSNSNLYEYVEGENRDSGMHDLIGEARSPKLSTLKKSVKSHVKLNQGQMHLSNYVDALQSDAEPHHFDGDADIESRRNNMASYYLGGPCRRKQTSDEDAKLRQDMKFRERLSVIGGINVKGPTTNSGPVPVDRLYRQDNPLEDRNKRVKIALAGQSNEVMSSSKNAVHQMKQKFTEKDLHRQVAAGCWTRMSGGRRKKEWPF